LARTERRLSESIVENNSGQGKNAPVPSEIDRWNWGAFFLSFVWGIANNVLISLLMFVPCIVFVMPFVLGARGSRWAWQNRRWKSVDQFQRVQRQWAQIAFALLGLGLTFCVALVIAINFFMKQTDVYKLSCEEVNHNPAATSLLGAPVDTGMVRGSISATGPAGSADISYSVKGPRAKGTLYTQATKTMGIWHIDAMELEVKGTPARVRLVPR
jgi:hypothetical protein